MKIALIFSYIIIAVLAVILFMQWRAITKLTPATPGTPGGAGTGTNSTRTSADGSAPFGDMIDAVKNKVKELEIKATF